MKQIYDEHGEPLGLYQLCEWFIENYPKDIFVCNPVEIVKIRDWMEVILSKKPNDGGKE